MTIPNLPTDNLYKFTFLSGITIIIVCAILLSTQTNSFLTKFDNVDLEIATEKINLDFLKSKASTLDTELKLEKARVDKIKISSADSIYDMDAFKKSVYKSKKYRDYLAFIYTYKNNFLPIEDMKIINQKKEVIEEKNRQAEIIGEKLTIHLKQLEHQANEIYTNFAFCCIGMFIGVIMANRGYKKWHELVQKPLDEKLKLELVQLRKDTEKNENDSI